MAAAVGRVLRLGGRWSAAGGPRAQVRAGPGPFPAVYACGGRLFRSPPFPSRGSAGGRGSLRERRGGGGVVHGGVTPALVSEALAYLAPTVRARGWRREEAALGRGVRGPAPGSPRPFRERNLFFLR